MQWREIDGYDWCVIDTPDTGPYLSLTLGYGLVHEPIDQFGTLQLAAGMLQAELSRPVETGPGQASVPEVAVTVGSDVTFLGMRGDVATLRAAWQRLADIFAGRQPLDAAPPVEVNISAAPRDLTSRFGLTSMTFAASRTLEVQTQPDPLALLRYLDPAASNVRAVMCTNTDHLMTSVFAPPRLAERGAERSRYRPEARPGAMEFRAGYPLVSIVVPSSADGAAAAHVLAQQLVQHVGDVTRRDLGVSVSLAPVGPDMLVTYMTAEAILYGEQRSQIHALVAAKPIPDHRIAEAVEHEVENRSLTRVLANRVLGLDDEFATVAATQQALAQARATMRFFTDAHSQTPPGYGAAADELGSPEGQLFKTKAGRDHLIVGNDVIERRRSGSKGIPSEYDRVDMNSLILVIDDVEDCVVLIDAEYRTVEIIFDTFRKERQLRELIAQRTAGVQRITARNAALPGPSRQRVRTTRTAIWGAILVPVVIIGFALFMSWMDDYRSVGEPAPEHVNPPAAQSEAEPEREPTAVDNTVGDTATLPNWSRVTVNSVTEIQPGEDAEFPTQMGHHYQVNVEYCAAEEDDSVDPEQFRMLHADPTQLAHTMDDIDDPLEASELSIGQCANGNVGFYIATDEPTELLVDYRQGDLGSLTWTVEDVE